MSRSNNFICYCEKKVTCQTETGALKSMLEPIASYRIEIGVGESERTKDLAQNLQRKLRRKAMAAPFYIQNIFLKRELGFSIKDRNDSKEWWEV